MGKSGGTHTVMSKKLAEALMDAGVQHFDAGGDASDAFKKYYSEPLWGWTGRLGNPGQSSYDAGAPVIENQTYGPRIGQLQTQQNDVYTQQQNLANALLSQSQGQGPNPAQTQLAQNTGNNVAQQAALMASQRGASGNPALLGRQAAMQGANIQQNAAGQAATLQAQQQLAAQNALAQQQAQMANQSIQQESIQQGGLAAQNTARTSGSLGMQGINAQTAQKNASSAAGLLGGAIGAIGGAFAMSKGGQVPQYSVGGQVNDNVGIADFQSPSMDNSHGNTDSNAGQDINSGLEAGKKIGGWLAAEGGGVPGKAEVKGNSKENDRVPVLLSPGEEVIDRETMQDPGPVGKAARMVAAHIKSKNDGQDSEEDDGGSPKAKEFMKHLKSKKKGYGGVIEARACGGKIK